MYKRMFLFCVSLSLPELITFPTYLNSGTPFSDLPSSQVPLSRFLSLPGKTSGCLPFTFVNK